MLSSVIVEERLRDMRVLRLGAVRGALEGAWATVAALAEKSPTREAANGKKFGVWTLTDLDGTSVKLYLFGEAFAEHWKETETSLLAILGARAKSDGDGPGGGGPGLSLSVDKASQLFRLGMAADFGRCKADRKDGKACSMAVNRAVSEYCCFHAAAAAKALQSGRMELGTGGLLAFSMRKAALAAAGGRGLAAGRGRGAVVRPPGVVGGVVGVRPPPRISAAELQRVATCAATGASARRHLTRRPGPTSGALARRAVVTFSPSPRPRPQSRPRWWCARRPPSAHRSGCGWAAARRRGRGSWC